MTQQPFFVKLKGRGHIEIKGKEAKTFLQGLITNDINLLNTQACVYACLLSPQGKFLYDFFITETEETLHLEYEGGERAKSLAQKLNMYKLRAAIDITHHEEKDVYAILGAEHGHKDPRHEDMGYRSFEKPDNLPEKPFEEWDKHRIALTIPDGSRDLTPEKSTMDEGHMDQLNAVCYDKGCYIGQELTARMHYRGLGKKHLQTVKIDTLPEKAELRSSCDNIGIALVKD